MARIEFSTTVVEGKCCICLDELSSSGAEEEVAIMPCTHLFHGACVRELMKRAKECPLCKTEL